MNTLNIKPPVIHHLPTPPDYYGTARSSDQLSTFDIERLGGITQAAYWYCDLGYEGSGYMIYQRTNGLWFTRSLSHCSCYGPTDDAGSDRPFESLESAFADLPQETQKWVQPLFDVLKGGSR